MKGNWHALPSAGPSTTTQGPGVVGSGVVLVLARVMVVGMVVEVVLVVDVDVVDVVEATDFLFVQTALQSNPELVFFLSVFQIIFAADWRTKGLLTEGLLEPQYLKTLLSFRYQLIFLLLLNPFP